MHSHEQELEAYAWYHDIGRHCDASLNRDAILCAASRLVARSMHSACSTFLVADYCYRGSARHDMYIYAVLLQA